MNHITKKELKIVKEKLPNLQEFIINKEANGYQVLYVSVFEKWMTREEYEIYDDIDREALHKRRNAFEDSVEKIYNLTPCYLWKYKRHKRFFIYRATSLRQILNKCDIKNQTFSTAVRYEILMPELNAIYSREFDWTNIIWYKEASKIQNLIKLIKDSGLYILE